MIPTYDDLKDYFKDNGRRRLCYKDATKLYNELQVHFDGETPIELLMKRRPSETDDIFTYRKAIYQPITTEGTDPVITALSKIKRSPDWGWDYPKDVPSIIAEDETLQQYCERNFPYQYKSVSNWIFGVLLKSQMIDANGVVMVMPLTIPEEDEPQKNNEYIQPWPTIFHSDCVYEFDPIKKIAVLLSQEKMIDANGAKKQGNIFYVVTDEVIQKWEQNAKDKTTYYLVSEYVHGLEQMPAFRMTGIFKKGYGPSDYLDKSRVQCMAPRLNEAAREYSDLQASIVQTGFPMIWEMKTQKCEECNGVGSVFTTSANKGKSGVGKKQVVCQKCNGTGTMGVGPYKKIQLEPKESGLDKELVIPPMGFVQRDVAILILQDKRVCDHIFKALSTINMQFLAKTPLSESGKAKEVDKDELNTFVYSVAEDLVKTMDLLYYFINEYRYKTIVPDRKARRAMLPEIPVPEKFDLVTGSDLIDEVGNAKNAGLSATGLQLMENDYIQKKYFDRPEVVQLNALMFDLDPMPSITEDEKLARLQGGGVTQESYIISSNIIALVKQAMHDDEDFYSIDRNEQLAKISELAKPIIAAQQLASKAKTDAAQALAQAQKDANAPEGN